MCSIKSYYFPTQHSSIGLCDNVLHSLRSVGRDSSVGITTRYGLNGPGIESRWGRDFPPVQTGPGTHPVSYALGTGSFPGVKRPGRGADHPPPSSTEVKERVQQYLYSLSGPLWPVLGGTLPFCLTQKYYERPQLRLKLGRFQA